MRDLASEGMDPSRPPTHGDGTRAGRLRPGPAAALLLLAVGFALRARGISEYWLNPDEGIYYSTLTQPSFGRFWAEVTANAHPPAFYLLLRGMGFLTWDFVWLRAAPLLFGTAAIWVFWLVGRELGGSGTRGTVTGLVAAALVALNPEAITLSQVMRPYTLVVLLLGASLLQLLRYRAEPRDATLFRYAGLLSLAVLCHYSAALAVAALCAVLAHDAATGRLDRRGALRLAAAQAVPLLLIGAVYVAHLGSALGSDLVGEALDPGGWLGDWLIRSPTDAWNSLVSYQIFHLPAGLRLSALALLLAAIATSAARGERLVAVLAVGGLGVAILASVLGVYPFGPSRHNAWLTVFTIPPLAWLAGLVASAPRGRAAAGLAGVAAVIAAGSAAEGAALGRGAESPMARSNATEEKVLRRVDLAALTVERLDPDRGPGLILMSEQSYNLMMPLFAGARRAGPPSADADLFRFRHGTREVVVLRQWDWSGISDVQSVLERIAGAAPEPAGSLPDEILVVAGGWGSVLLAQVPELDRLGVITDRSWALGRDPAGQPVIRMMALVVDRRALSELAPAPPG